MRGWMDRERIREDLPTRPTNSDQLKLAKLSETDDIEAYLTTFERMMQVYGVSQDRWAFKLAPQLTGKALQAYADLGADEAGDYEQVKMTILERYDISAETYRRRFRTAKRNDGESYREMAIRLHGNAKKWMAGCETMEAVLEKIVVEQLINTMSADLRVWISERKPETGSEAGKLADDYMQARCRDSGWKKRAEEPRRGQLGDSRRCHTCGAEEHLSRNCPRRRNGGQSNEPERDPVKTEHKNLKCYNCGVLGHISTNCTAKSKALFCGNRLPNGDVARAGVVEGKLLCNIVLDTGCSQTMIHSKFVNEGKILEGEAVTVRCAHGDTVLYPLAEVDMEVGGLPIRVKAAVADRLPVSVLLGTDVPVLGKLLQANPNIIHTEDVQDALVVQTRAQIRQAAADEAIRLDKEKESGTQSKPVEVVEDASETLIEWPGSGFDSDLFRKSKERLMQTRSQKRQERHKHGLIRAKDKKSKPMSTY